MSVYISRNQPRRQTVIAGKIKDTERYDRYYDVAHDALQKGIFPRVTLPVGQLVVRVMKGPYNARSIPPGSSKGTGNRFNGLRLDGRAGHGALYVGTVAGVLREYTHYSVLEKQEKDGSAIRPAVLESPGSQALRAPIWKPAAADETADFMKKQRTGALPLNTESKFYLFRINRTLQFADLRITTLAPFMAQLRASGARRYGISSGSMIDLLAMVASNPDDYSASRGFADAVFDLRRRTVLAGVCAFSSRADSDSGLVTSSQGDRTGGLIYAIFGEDSAEITALAPVPKSQNQVGFDTFAELTAALQPKP
jgi:hypothetical protein